MNTRSKNQESGPRLDIYFLFFPNLFRVEPLFVFLSKVETEFRWLF